MSTITAGSAPDTRKRPGSPLIAIGNEIVKGLRHGWGERTQILIELPLFVTFMVLLGFTVGRGDELVAGRMEWTMDTAAASWMFLGIAVYILVYLQIQKMFWRLLAEIQTGTIEQTYLSPLPSWVHTIVGRAISTIVETAIVVTVVYVVTNLVVELDFAWRPDVLIPIVFLLAGSVGFSLIIAGLTLVFKRIEMFNDLVLLFVMFISGVIIRTDQLPTSLESISPFLFLTHPVESIRTIMLEDRGLSLWGTGGWAALIGTTVAWLAIGLAIFRFCERAAKRRGSLGRY